jgi:HEPN domain-containing protein
LIGPVGEANRLIGPRHTALADRSTDWLEQARRDLEQAGESMRSGRHEWACFAAHQAVEKALKALNLALGQQAWGHTLSRLWAALPRQAWAPEPPADLEDRLRLLDGFYIPTRYPDSYPEGTPGEHFGRLQSEQALLHADAILRWSGAALAQLRAGDRAGEGLGEDPAAPEP